jgi:hypothetical protein
VNGQTSPGIPVRTWRDLWAFVIVIALIVASFTVLQVQSTQHAADIQELKQNAVRKDVLDPQLSEMQQRLVRIENKLDAQNAATH